MAGYPIFFAFKNVVACGESKALITAKGRALLVYEDGKWWLYGVQPGGMAANGPDPKTAFKEFHKAFGNIMRDIALEADCPKDFEREAHQFFGGIDKADEKTWDKARKKIRAGELAVPQKLRGIKKISDDFNVALSIIIAKIPDTKTGDIILQEDRFSAAA